MNEFFKSPMGQFAVFVTIAVVYAVAASTSLQPVLEEALINFTSATSAVSPAPLPSSSPSPAPSVVPNLPSVQGVSIASNSAHVVSEVIDGDTIRISTGETIRYIGIDTPETKDPRRPKECFGEEASRFNEDMVLGKTVQLEKDVSETDKYGRLLRYIWLDGVMVNQTLVAAGYANASAYPPDIKHQSLLDAAEREARENNRGLWGACGEAI